MDSKMLNLRKKELLDAQERMLNAASDAKVNLTQAEEETFTNQTKEIESINVNLSRIEAIAKGRHEVGIPSQQVLIPDAKETRKYSNCTPQYADAFWKAMSTSFKNTNSLAEV